MDYEKAYKEALERAKNMIDDLRKGEDILAVSELEAMFPELKESEDERIRKAIIHYILYETKGTISEATEHTWVKWLEKQKEEEGMITVSKEAWDENAKDSFERGIKVGMIRQQKEQKPNYCHYGGDPSVERCKYCSAACSARLTEEQKYAEWGEEDEKMRNLAIEWAETMSGQLGFVDMDSTDFRKIIKWLKSLRPSWKPSKEQMEAFKGYIEDFQAKAEAAVGGWNNFDVMIRLYEQLKKL